MKAKPGQFPRMWKWALEPLNGKYLEEYTGQHRKMNDSGDSAIIMK